VSDSAVTTTTRSRSTNSRCPLPETADPAGDPLSRNNNCTKRFPLWRSTQHMEFRSVANNNFGAVISGGTSGNQRPCRDAGVGAIAPGFAMLNRASALHTLIRQRHLTPSCGGQVPTAERTLAPARMLKEVRPFECKHRLRDQLQAEYRHQPDEPEIPSFTLPAVSKLCRRTEEWRCHMTNFP
jgi:hypothetical protein